MASSNSSPDSPSTRMNVLEHDVWSSLSLDVAPPFGMVPSVYAILFEERSVLLGKGAWAKLYVVIREQQIAITRVTPID